MINLLPPGERQKLFLEKRKKMSIIFGIVVLTALACLILILASIRFYILTEADYQKNILARARQENETKDFTDLNKIARRYNGILIQLDSFFKKEIYFNRALEIITKVPSADGLRLANFSLSRGDGGSIKVSVSGVSDTRDNLLVYKKNIEADSEIKNPYFSPDSWISPKNVNFSLTFDIEQNAKQ